MRRVSLKAIIRTSLLSLTAYKQAGTGTVPVVAHLNSLLKDRHGKTATCDFNIQVWFSSLSTQVQRRGNQIDKVAFFSSACLFSSQSEPWFSLQRNIRSRVGVKPGNISGHCQHSDDSQFGDMNLNHHPIFPGDARLESGGRWRGDRDTPLPPSLIALCASRLLWSISDWRSGVINTLVTCMWKNKCWLFFFFPNCQIGTDLWCVITCATSFITSQPHPDSVLSSRSRTTSPVRSCSTSCSMWAFSGVYRRGTWNIEGEKTGSLTFEGDTAHCSLTAGQPLLTDEERCLHRGRFQHHTQLVLGKMTWTTQHRTQTYSAIPGRTWELKSPFESEHGSVLTSPSLVSACKLYL